MTQLQEAGVIPVLTLGWRLRMALEQGDVQVQEMAEHLGVSRETIRRYTIGETVPKRHVLLTWARVTGVDAEWLETGDSAKLQQHRQTAWFAAFGSDLRGRWELAA